MVTTGVANIYVYALFRIFTHKHSHTLTQAYLSAVIYIKLFSTCNGEAIVTDAAVFPVVQPTASKHSDSFGFLIQEIKVPKTQRYLS